MAKFSGERRQGGRVNSRGFKVLFEFAGHASAFVEAEHPERASQFVGYSGGFLLQRGVEDSRAGRRGRRVEQSKAVEYPGLVALPQGSDLLLRG